jgi:hypothetical protein
MLDKVNIFTKGFDDNVDSAYPHLPTSINYLKAFKGKGYYLFVENRLHHDYKISGEFNGHELVFISVMTGNLIQAEINVENIKKGKNNYKITLTHKHDKNLNQEEKEGSLVV